MDGRVKNGGRRVGAGRKPKVETLEFVRLLEECWTLEERRETIRRLSAMALRGNLAAAQLLLAYAYGKPGQRVEVSGPNGAPLEARTVIILPDNGRSLRNDG